MYFFYYYYLSTFWCALRWHVHWIKNVFLRRKKHWNDIQKKAQLGNSSAFTYTSPACLHPDLLDPQIAWRKLSCTHSQVKKNRWKGRESEEVGKRGKIRKHRSCWQALVLLIGSKCPRFSPIGELLWSSSLELLWNGLRNSMDFICPWILYCY